MTVVHSAARTSATSARTMDLHGRRVVMVSVVGAAEDQEPVLTAEDGRTLVEAIQMARRQGLPFIMILRTTGVSVNDGLGAASAWAQAARELVRSSGIIPTMAVAAGPVVSGPALLLGLVDLVALTADAYSYLSGPKNVETYTGVPVSAQELGGAGAHLRSSGVASLLADSLDEALDALAHVLEFLPDSVDHLPPVIETADPADRPTPEAGALLPEAALGSYDVRKVIGSVCDDGEFVELRASWAPNLVTGLARFGGLPVGVVANQTQALAGSIDIPASQKGARFVAMCDAFNLPLVTFVDTSGFLPGKDLEWRGMIRHGAQLAFAYARATVPRVGLILRKSYGGAYIVMDSVNMGNDLMLAWPSAEVAVMGAKGAVGILHRKADPDERAELEARYEATYLTPYPATERASINAIIDPADTRRELVAALAMLWSKRERLKTRRHDNTPL